MTIGRLADRLGSLWAERAAHVVVGRAALAGPAVVTGVATIVGRIGR